MTAPCYVRVQTYDIFRGDFEAEKVIDYNDQSDRRWLAVHSHWALRNGKSIVTTPIENRLSGLPYHYNNREVIPSD